MQHWFIVSDVAFSPDGQMVASASLDGTIHLSDAAEGRVRRTLQADAPVYAIAFRPDTMTLAASLTNGSVELWDWQRGERLQTFHCSRPGNNTYRQFPIALSPDGQTLAWGGWNAEGNGRVQLWDVAAGSGAPAPPRTPIALRATPYYSLAYSPDGKTLAVTGYELRPHLCDATTGQVRQRFELGKESACAALTWQPGGRLVATAEQDGSVVLWNSDTAQIMASWQAHDQTNRLTFAPSGRVLATSSMHSDMVRLWEVPSGRLQREVRMGQGIDPVVAISMDGRRLATGGGDNSVLLWDLETGLRLHEPAGHQGWIRSLAVSPDGRQIVTGGFDQTVRQWDTSTGRLQRTLHGHQAAVSGVAFSPDGGRIASASRDRTVRLWDAANGMPVGQYTGHTAEVNAVAFLPDGQRIASGGADLLIRLWDAATLQEKQTLTGFKDEIKHLAFDPTGHRLAAVGGQFLDINPSRDDVRVWDLHSPARPVLLHGAGNLAGTQAAFSADGSLLAVACNNPDALVRLWDVGTGKPFNPRHAFGHRHASTGVAFHPHRRLLASSGADGCVTVRHLDALWVHRVIRLGPTCGHLYQIAFSPDGQHLVTANGNGTATVLRLVEVALVP